MRQVRIPLYRTKDYFLYQVLNIPDDTMQEIQKYLTLEFKKGAKWDYPTVYPHNNAVAFDRPEAIPLKVRNSVINYLTKKRQPIRLR